MRNIRILQHIFSISIPKITWSKYGINGGFRVKMWNFGPRNFKPFGVQYMNPGWLISGPKVTKNKQVFKTNTLIWNLLSREWLLKSKMAFWRAITGFKKLFKRYEHVLRTFHMLRTCVINFLLLKLWKQIWFRMKITKSPWKQQTMKISKKHAISANITPWLNRI